MGRPAFDDLTNAQQRTGIIMAVREIISAQRKVTMRRLGSWLFISACTPYRIFPGGKREIMRAALTGWRDAPPWAPSPDDDTDD